MKGFVLLAALLLVPSMAYFQKLYYESGLKQELRTMVEEVLAAEGVEGGTARMDWLDAIISGHVETEERRRKVGEAVARIEGVRLPPSGNLLRAQGWIEILRKGGRWAAQGVVPRDFEILLPREADPLDEDIAIRRSAYVVAPAGAFEWGEFLEDYFDGPGDRSVTLRGGRLLMRGDATLGLRSDWLAKASGVVGKESVDERFTLHPSIYHMPGYQPVSIDDENDLARLRERLQFGAVVFAPGSAEVPASESAKVSGLATAILSSPDEVRYVVGGHPAPTGNALGAEKLALRRAEAVVGLLLEYGVREEQLEARIFGRGAQGGREDRVEILVK